MRFSALFDFTKQVGSGKLSGDMLLRVSILTLLALMLISPIEAEIIEVKDNKGRPLSINLLSFSGEKVTFTVPAQGAKEYHLALEKFDSQSQADILETAKTLKPKVPPVKIEISIGKRRKKESFYMVRQTINSKIVITNTSVKLKFPKVKARILFIGRNQRNPDKYSIITTETFDVELDANRSLTHETKPFTTRYDSDNKGVGNVGGYRFDCYVIAVFDNDGKILSWKTSDGGIRTICEKDIGVLSKAIDYPKSTLIDEDLKKLKSTTSTP